MGRSCRFKHRSQRGCLEEVKCEEGFGGRDGASCVFLEDSPGRVVGECASGAHPAPTRAVLGGDGTSR